MWKIKDTKVKKDMKKSYKNKRNKKEWNSNKNIKLPILDVNGGWRWIDNINLFILNLYKNV